MKIILMLILSAVWIHGQTLQEIKSYFDSSDHFDTLKFIDNAEIMTLRSISSGEKNPELEAFLFSGLDDPRGIFRPDNDYVVPPPRFHCALYLSYLKGYRKYHVFDTPLKNTSIKAMHLFVQETKNRYISEKATSTKVETENNTDDPAPVSSSDKSDASNKPSTNNPPVAKVDSENKKPNYLRYLYATFAIIGSALCVYIVRRKYVM